MCTVQYNESLKVEVAGELRRRMYCQLVLLEGHVTAAAVLLWAEHSKL